MKNCLKARLFIYLLMLTVAAHAQKPVVNAPKPAINEFAAVDNIALQKTLTQFQSTADIATYINEHFTRQDDKIRAIFIWVAANISYDVDNMYAVNLYEKPEDRLAKTLKTGKGICFDYATLFCEVCSKCNISAYLVPGYAKQPGKTELMPHAWAAAATSSGWQLFDPTWASGCVTGGKYVSKINNDYYMAKPALLIKTHMPYDPMWQLSTAPVSPGGFMDGTGATPAGKPYFAYADSITAWMAQGKKQRALAEFSRLEQAGARNSLIYDHMQHLQADIQNADVAIYNDAVAQYNTAVNDFNAYIAYYNKQFKPTRPDPEIQAMIDMPAKELADAKAKLASINDPQPSIAAMIKALTGNVTDLQTRVTEQKEFLVKYFSKGKLGRKGMFTRYSWMGIPLN